MKQEVDYANCYSLCHNLTDDWHGWLDVRKTILIYKISFYFTSTKNLDSKIFTWYKLKIFDQI